MTFFNTCTFNLLPHFRLLSAIPYLVNVLNQLSDASNLAIAFPDEGAWKRFGLTLNKWPLITCNKVRSGNDERIVTIKEGLLLLLFVIIINFVVIIIFCYYFLLLLFVVIIICCVIAKSMSRCYKHG